METTDEIAAGHERDMAKADIQAKKDLSPVVRELANANETIRQMQIQLAELASRLDAEDDGMDGTLHVKPKRGRPAATA